MGTIDTQGNIHRSAGSPGGGRFTGRVNAEPAGALTEHAVNDRSAALHAEYRALAADRNARATLFEVGSLPGPRAELAAATTDPAVLAVLTGDTDGTVAQAVAGNPATPACALHDIATDRRSSRRYEDRVAAMVHPNTDRGTLERLWAGIPGDDPVAATALRRDIALAPNAPAEMLTVLLDEHVPAAGAHLNLPAHTLDHAIADPTRAHLVIDHPALTDAQLRVALRATAPHQFDDEDDIWPAVVAAGAARHPNASADLISRLAESHPDAQVRMTAHHRLTGGAAASTNNERSS